MDDLYFKSKDDLMPFPSPGDITTTNRSFFKPCAEVDPAVAMLFYMLDLNGGTLDLPDQAIPEDLMVRYSFEKRQFTLQQVRD